MHFPHAACTAHETLDALTDRRRYAEVFSYNDETETFSLADVET